MRIPFLKFDNFFSQFRGCKMNDNQNDGQESTPKKHDEEWLRSEIVETQKVRSDLLKWKLIITAVLGAAGLGLSKDLQITAEARYLLCLIPLVCQYVDMLCKNLNMRTYVISRYILSENRTKSYETFAQEARAMDKIDFSWEFFWGYKKKKIDAYALEDIALQWSTRVLSTMVIILGFHFYPIKNGVLDPSWWVFIVSGGGGLILSFITEYIYQRRCAAVAELQ